MKKKRRLLNKESEEAIQNHKNLNMTFVKGLKDRLGEAFSDFLIAYDDKPSRGIMLNLNKISCHQFEKSAPFKVSPVPWARGGYYLEEDFDLARHPYYHAGLYYIQEPSAMLPVSMLFFGDKTSEGAPAESERAKCRLFLDACSAPGGKSVQALNYMKNGILISNEINDKRIKAVIRNLEKCGKAEIVIIKGDANNLGELPKYCSHILLDAPCSGEGSFRKDPQLLKSYKTRGPEFYVDIQRDLISSVFIGGARAVYSSCTFSKKENEEQIEEFLKGGAQLLNQKLLMPHVERGEGHFSALLQLNGDDKLDFPANDIALNLDASLEKYFNEFCEKYLLDNSCLGIKSGERELYSINNKLFLKPQNIKSHWLVGKDIVRLGLYLGEVGKHFEPSQAFAYFLEPQSFKNNLDFDMNDYRAIKYLKGESLNDYASLEGYILVSVDGYSLGFAKVDNGVFKNLYDRNRRILK